MNLNFKAKDLIEFIGDSITDADHMHAPYEPYGDGYVRFIHHLLQTGYPELRLKVLNKGISGDRVTDLKNRWKSDVLEIKPNWLFIYIGINDVWRYFEGNRAEAVPLAEFENTYRQLINGARTNTESQIRMVAPFLAEKDPTDSFRVKLSNYQDAIDKLSKEFSIPVVHLQPAFDWAMLSEPSRYWATDRVHPTEVGHMLIALTILRTCGYRL